MFGNYQGIDPSRSSSLTKNISRRNNRFEDSEVVFYDKNARPSKPSQWSPICDREDKRRSSKTKQCSIKGLTQHHLFINLRCNGCALRQYYEVPRFGSNCTYTIGFVNLDLIVDPVRAAYRFHVIDSRRPTTYLSYDPESIVIKLERKKGPY